MAKTKAELQADAAQYHATLEQMRTAHNEGHYVQAINLATYACDYVDGMMQFERRFENRPEHNSVESIDYILRYAPLLFEYESLEKLLVLLKSQKRIEKNTKVDLAGNLAKSESLMWDAHQLWSHLENVNEAHQDKLRTAIGGDQDRWRWIAEQWNQLGLVTRFPEKGSYRIKLTTRITAIVRAKCSSCGVIAKAAMGRFLEQNKCPKCSVTGYFVFLVDEAA